MPSFTAQGAVAGRGDVDAGRALSGHPVPGGEGDAAVLDEPGEASTERRRRQPLAELVADLGRVGGPGDVAHQAFVAGPVIA